MSGVSMTKILLSCVRQYPKIVGMVLIVTNVWTVAAFSPPPSSFAPAAQDMRDDFYNFLYEQTIQFSKDGPTTEAIRQSFEPWFQRAAQFEPESGEYLYLMALIHRELFRVLRQLNNETALSHYEQALALADKAVKSNLTDADIYALYANLQYLRGDIYSGLDRAFYLNTQLAANRQAFTLDRHHPRALETQGLNFISAPDGLGGSSRNAIQAFEEQIRYGNRYFRLWGRVWQAIAYYRDGRKSQALAILDEVQQEAPDHPYIIQVKKSIDNNIDPFENSQ